YEDQIRLIIPSSFHMQDDIVWLASKSRKICAPEINSESPNLEFNWEACILNVKTETPSLENQNGAIPVGLNLAGRGLSGDIRCKHCGQHETDLHFFLECPFANRVWNLIPALHMPSSINVNSTTQLIPDADLSPWVLWYLWTARNKLCFENVLLSEQEVATLAIKEARPWQNAQQCKAPFSLPITTSKSNQPITLPTEPQCFVDAAWSLATQLGGFGWVINDPISGVS
ncbi:hypothetical protein HID58_012349, partial [Brassica napus]